MPNGRRLKPAHTGAALALVLSLVPVGATGAQGTTLSVGNVRFAEGQVGARRHCPESLGSRDALAVRLTQGVGRWFEVAATARRSRMLKDHGCPLPPIPPPSEGSAARFIDRTSIEGSGYTAFDMQARVRHEWGRWGAVGGVGAGWADRSVGNSPFRLASLGARARVGPVTAGLDVEWAEWRVWEVTREGVFGVGGTFNVRSTRRDVYWADGRTIGIWLGLAR